MTSRITVAIPTIDGRAKYLQSCLNTCITQDADFEILVSDNPGGEARDLVRSLNDARVRYVTPPQYLPMSAHFDFALTQVRGDVVTFIGDDDGLMPGCINRVIELIEHTDGLPIHHSLANYFWPDFTDEAKRNTAIFFHPTGCGEQVVPSEVYLRSVARGRTRYVDGPTIYHNFVPVSLLRRIAAGEPFFRRASPDVYASVAIAAHVSEFVSTQELLTLSGQSARSNGAAVRKKAAQQFVAEMNQHYAPRFESKSVQMQFLDCLIEVAEHFSRPELLREVDMGAIRANVLFEARLMHAEQRNREVISALINRDFLDVCWNVLARVVERLGRPVTSRLGPKASGVLFTTGQSIALPAGVSTIHEAAQSLSRQLATGTRDLSTCAFEEAQAE